MRRNVSNSTQNQALNALAFLYDKVLERELGELEAFARARRPRNRPVVLSRREVRALLDRMEGSHNLLASLLYGTGMRLLEALRLRVQDIDFADRRIHVHQTKGRKDRYVPLPDALAADLRRQIDAVRRVHGEDRAAGYGEAVLPDAVARISHQPNSACVRRDWNGRGNARSFGISDGNTPSRRRSIPIPAVSRSPGLDVHSRDS